MKEMMKAIRSGHPPTLFSAFLHFDVSFMVWVLIGALGIYIARDLHLTTVEKGWIVSIPLLGGAFFRIILGFLVDRFGPKKIGMLSLSIALLPLVWGWKGATSLNELMGVGFLLGIAGASFAVALPLASRAYPREYQGIAMGIAGAGNSGTMIAVLIAPLLAESLGWHAVFGLAMLPVVGTLACFTLLVREPAERPAPRPLSAYLALLKQADLWWFNLYYSVTFGGFVGLASFFGLFFHDRYGLSPVAAGAITALCVFGGSFFRPVGGHLADRIGGRKLLTGLYLIIGLLFATVASLPPVVIAVSLLFCCMAALGMGNGAIFQQVPQRFQEEIGLVSGIVGAAGGIGGFFLPPLLTKMKALTDSYAGGFLLFGLMALFCFATLFLSRKRIEAQQPNPIPAPEEGEGRIRMEVVFGG
ncbi:MAG: NarK/NasA family nitrate transporter [Nitrospirae bacterium]|nr:NarK/NasA family nitrate transporter [Candidatus Manganitrophaceae bacterium]